MYFFETNYRFYVKPISVVSTNYQKDDISYLFTFSFRIRPYLFGIKSWKYSIESTPFDKCPKAACNAELRRVELFCQCIIVFEAIRISNLLPSLYGIPEI